MELFLEYKLQREKMREYLKVIGLLKEEVTSEYYNKLLELMVNKKELEELEVLMDEILYIIYGLKSKEYKEHFIIKEESCAEKYNYEIKEEVYSRYWTRTEEKAYDCDKNENAFKSTEIGNLRKESDLRKIIE